MLKMQLDGKGPLFCQMLMEKLLQSMTIAAGLDIIALLHYTSALYTDKHTHVYQYFYIGYIIALHK